LLLGKTEFWVGRKRGSSWGKITNCMGNDQGVCHSTRKRKKGSRSAGKRGRRREVDHATNAKSCGSVRVPILRYATRLNYG